MTIDPSVLAVCVLLTCLVCMWMVFFFGRRLQSSAYLRDSLIEGVKQQELKSLIRELHDRACEGPLDPNSPPPEHYGSTRRLWERDSYGGVPQPTSDWKYGNDATGSEEAKRERLRQEEEERKRVLAINAWESAEKVRYEKLRQEADATALVRAEKKVPSGIDISLLGGGWAFLLEFSTVIVIIFTLLILGILGTLEGKEIATILAAIAGYVLGKASAAGKHEERPAGKALAERVGK